MKTKSPKKNWRNLALALTVILVAGGLAACGQKTADSGSEELSGTITGGQPDKRTVEIHFAQTYVTTLTDKGYKLGVVYQPDSEQPVVWATLPLETNMSFWWKTDSSSLKLFEGWVDPTSKSRSDILTVREKVAAETNKSYDYYPGYDGSDLFELMKEHRMDPPGEDKVGVDVCGWDPAAGKTRTSYYGLAQTFGTGDRNGATRACYAIKTPNSDEFNNDIGSGLHILPADFNNCSFFLFRDGRMSTGQLITKSALSEVKSLTNVTFSETDPAEVRYRYNDGGFILRK